MGLTDSPRLPEPADSDGGVSDVGDSDVGEPDVGLALDGRVMLPDTGDVELGAVSLDRSGVALLGVSDDGADALDNARLCSDEPTGLPESPALPDCGETDSWLPLDGPPSLDVWLSDSWDAELAGGLDSGESSLLFVVDISETLDWLAELAGEVTELPDWTPLLWPLIEPRELAGESLSLVGLALLAPLCESDEVGLASDDSPEGSDDLVLNDDGRLSPLDAWLDGCEDRGEPGDDDAAEGGLEVSLDWEDPLGWDDELCSASLDGPCEDCEWLDGLVDEPDRLEPEDLDCELPEIRDPLLSDERLSDDGSDVDDEPLLLAADEPDELSLLSPLLEERVDDFEPELRDPDEMLSDEPDELGRDLLRSELLGELLEELSDEPRESDRLLDDRPDDSGLLDSELRRLLGLLFDELSTELEPLLTEESLDELGDDRDDSLTLENDLLDPEMTDDELIRHLPDRRYE